MIDWHGIEMVVAGVLRKKKISNLLRRAQYLFQ